MSEATKNQEIMEQETTDIISVTEDASNELAAVGAFDKLNIAKDICSGGKGWCSMTAADDEAKITLYNACTNPQKLSDMINKRIKMIHVYAEIIQCAHVDEDRDGETTLVSCPRVIIIDEQGKGYQAVSVGVYNAIKRIIAMFGMPETWDKPHTVEVQHVNLKNGQHTFNLVMID